MAIALNNDRQRHVSGYVHSAREQSPTLRSFLLNFQGSINCLASVGAEPAGLGDDFVKALV
jgi:hypothetical protein